MAASSSRTEGRLRALNRAGPVLLLSSELSKTGGLASHVFDLATALHDAGAGVTIAAVPLPAGGGREPGPPVVHPFPLVASTGASLDEIVDLAAALAPQVIHIHGAVDRAALTRLRQFAPVVQSVHGLDSCMHGLRYFKPGHECRRPHDVGCVGNSLLRNCGHRRVPMFSPAKYRRTSEHLRVLRQVDAVVAYSDFVREDLLRNGVPDVTVLRLFVQDQQRAVRAPPDPRRVLFAGRVVAEKGLHILLRALQDVNATLDVRGDGWDLERCRTLCRRLGLEGRVQFRGWAAAAAMDAAYARCAVVAVPSLLPEPVGLVGLEAMIHGVPVVASSTGGISEWLEDGVNGYLVRPGDPKALARGLQHILDNPAEGLEMGGRGRARALTSFTVERHLRELRSVYAAATDRWQATRA